MAGKRHTPAPRRAAEILLRETARPLRHQMLVPRLFCTIGRIATRQAEFLPTR